jgi:hypothetical protein
VPLPAVGDEIPVRRFHHDVQVFSKTGADCIFRPSISSSGGSPA